MLLPTNILTQVIDNAESIISGIKIPFFLFCAFWLLLGVASIFNKKEINTKEDATIEALDDLNDNFNTYNDYDD